jgi:cytochrome c biogenesis protein ResB
MTFEITINADLQFPLTVTIHDGETNIPVTASTITEPGTYTIAVNEPFNSTNAILELNTDFGSQYEFAIETTSCVSTEEIVASNTSIQAYPNPSEGLVTLMTSTPHAIVTIYDIVGNQVLNRVRADRSCMASIDMSQLPVGLYFARIGDKTIKLEKK